MAADYDWSRVAAQVPASGWVLLAKGERYTVAETLRQGKVRAMRGIKVRTRNTRRGPDGRTCDIYLAREEDTTSAANDDAGRAADG